ncbi:hypothetical protein HanIR_Chr16g0842631 [Helianthus annuus]|nr:hypothetical protein HanIR_Chr16g0842631 [Helianthus annuus]
MVMSTRQKMSRRRNEKPIQGEMKQVLSLLVSRTTWVSSFSSKQSFSEKSRRPSTKISSPVTPITAVKSSEKH